MNEFSPSVAAGLAQFIDYAYDMASTPVGTTPPTPSGFPSGYTIVAYAQAQDDFWGYDNPACYGFVAQSTATNQIIVAIRGTVFIVEWLIDFEAGMTPFDIPDSGLVEDGFYSVFSTLTFVDPNLNPFNLQGFLVDALNTAPATEIIIEGHSLGGPIASMLALQCTCQSPVLQNATTVYTYAAPAPGDETFADFYNANAPQTFRVWNILDPVPTVLLLAGFEQIAGDGVRLVPTLEQLEGYDFLFILCNHSLMTYQWLLESQYPLASMCQPLLPAASQAEMRQRSIAAIKARKAMKATRGKAS
jgi:triacylglycerol lipase